MDNYTGEDMLNVFHSLNVQMGDLHPNVIKAWFDTDCKDMKNLLNWMCSALSEDNYISALEKSEYDELEKVVKGERYEEELQRISSEFPGIFEAKTNCMEIEMLQDELDALLEEETHLDNLIALNEVLEENLNRELANVASRDTKVLIKCKESEEKCLSSAKKLEEINKELHKQLTKYASNLEDFETNSVPLFVNNIPLNRFVENFDNVKHLLKMEVESNFPHNSIAPVSNTIVSEIIADCDDSEFSVLNTLRNRLLHSHQIFLVNKIEIEKLTDILYYLNKNCNAESILSSSTKEGVNHERNVDEKEQSKKRMLEMLDKLCAEQAEFQISHAKLKYASMELEKSQLKLNNLNKLAESLDKLLAQYILLYVLHDSEKNDMDGLDSFFRKISKYIGTDIQGCISRTEKMKEIVANYQTYCQKPMKEKNHLVKSIVATLLGNDYSLDGACAAMQKFKSEIAGLESRLFCDHLKKDQNLQVLQVNIEILKKFLMCGPTNRIVLIPPELHVALSKVEEHLKKEVAAVSAVVAVPLQTKKKATRKQNYERKLWMYFLTNPQKMFSLLQQAEEELKLN